jgi:hypothetical protein
MPQSIFRGILGRADASEGRACDRVCRTAVVNEEWRGGGW